MKAIIFILIYVVSVSHVCAQKQVKTERIIYDITRCKGCPTVKDTVLYKLLPCGLYRSSYGELAYRTKETPKKNFDRRTTYLTSIMDELVDTVGGQMREMKDLVDIASFHFLNSIYWVDKNNVYFFTPNSDGGTIYRSDKADRKSFLILEYPAYALDKRYVYYEGNVIEGADPNTFKTINRSDYPEICYDKKFFYKFGQRLTENEVKEWNLDHYRK